MADQDDERLSTFLENISAIPEAIEKGKKGIVVNHIAPSKAKRNRKQIQLSQEVIEQQYGKAMKEAAQRLGVSESTLKRKRNGLSMSVRQRQDLSQRKETNSNKNQSNLSHANEECNGAIPDPLPVNRYHNTVTIKARYVFDIIKLHLHISEATFAAVENEIGRKFKLTVGTFKIKYLDEDKEWILMTSDQDMSDCIECSRNLDQHVGRLIVYLDGQ